MHRKGIIMQNIILETALRQAAIDCCCTPADFLKPGVHTFVSKPQSGMSVYLQTPLCGEIVTFGTGCVVAASQKEVAAVLTSYLTKYPHPHGFATPDIIKLAEMLRPYSIKPAWQGEYFLPDIPHPDPDLAPVTPCHLSTRVLTQPDFKDLYLPTWSNALCRHRPEKDMVGVGAYDGDTLVAFAACSADCPDMWQIGVDVLPDYRRMGLAAAVTSRLTKEIFSHGKIPFYCAAWSNLASVRNALRCGYRPAWVRISCMPL